MAWRPIISQRTPARLSASRKSMGETSSDSMPRLPDHHAGRPPSERQVRLDRSDLLGGPQLPEPGDVLDSRFRLRRHPTPAGPLQDLPELPAQNESKGLDRAQGR